LFRGLHSAAWLRRLWFRAALIGVSCMVMTLSTVYSVAMFASNFWRVVRMPDLEPADAIAFHPLTLAVVLVVACGAGWYAHRSRIGPDVALGLLIGELTVLATIALNYVVLLLGGETNWTQVANIVLIVHLPLAVLEGIILGFLVGFLARVQPGLLGWTVERVDDTPGRIAHAVPPVTPVLVGPGANGQSGGRASTLREVPGAAGEQGASHELLRPG
jgi:Cobalt uptake substrate-specific transmembrane region